MTREPVLPTLRAAVFTAVCLGLGVAAHRVMSGAAIPVWAVVLGGLGAFVSARFGARRERGLAEITLLMGVAQIALHLLFSYAQDVAASASSMPASVSTSMPGMNMPAGTPMPALGVASAGGGMRMSAGMLLGHALAALVCAWWLRRGEAALHAVVHSTARWVVDRLVPPSSTAPAAPVAGAATVGIGARVIEPVALALRSQWLRTTRALRGPPKTPSFA